MSTRLWEVGTSSLHGRPTWPVTPAVLGLAAAGEFRCEDGVGRESVR